MADEKISLGDLLKEEPKEKQTKKVSLGDLLKEEPVKKKELALPSTDFSASSQFLQEKPTSTQIPFKEGAKERLDVQKELEPQIKKQKEIIELGKVLDKPLPYKETQLADFNINRMVVKRPVSPIDEKAKNIENAIQQNKLRALEGKRDLLNKRAELDSDMSKIQSLKSEYERATNDITRQSLSQEYSRALEGAKAKEEELNQLKTNLDNIEISANKLEKGVKAIKSMGDNENSGFVNSLNNFYNEAIPKLVKGAGTFIGAMSDIASTDPRTMFGVPDVKTTGDYVRNNLDKTAEALSLNVDDEFKNKNLFEKDANGDYANLKSPTAWANFLSGGLGSMTATIGAGLIGGAPAAATIGTLQIMPDIYEGAKEAGLNNQEAALFSIPLALGLGQIERIGAAPFIKQGARKAFYKQFGSEMASNVAGKKVTPELIQSVMGNSYKTALDKVSSKLGNIITDTLPEAGEETLQSAIEGVYKMGYDATYGKGKEKGEGAFGTTFKDVFVNAIESGVGGAIIALPYSSIKNLSSSQKREFINLVKDASNDKEVYNSVIEGLDELKANNEINQGQYNQYVKRFNDMVALNKKIPPKIDGEARLDAMELVKRKEELEEERKVVDSSFHEETDNEISKIEKDLKELATQPTKPVTPPPAAEVTLPEVEVTAEKPAPTEPIEAQKVEVKEEPKEVVAEEVVTEEKPIEEVAVTEEAKPVEEVAVKEEMPKEEVAPEVKAEPITEEVVSEEVIPTEEEVKAEEVETEVEKKDRVTRLKDKVNKLKESIKGFKYEQRWKDAEAKFMKEYELAKQKGASDAKLKEMTDKYKSKVKSLEEELKQEKKERRYELKYLEAEANTVKDWLGENKSLLKGLTDAEYQRLTKKLTGTGLRSDIDDVMEYLDKMVGNADYNNKLSQAKKLNKGLKLLSKSKSTLVNEREALKKFISVKPSSSWDVAKLDEYNKFAKELIDSVSPVKNVKGKPERKTKTITTEQIDNKYETLKNDYDNEVLSKLIKDNAWYFINKKFTIEDIDKIKADLEFINGKDLDAQKQALERLDQRKEFKEAMKEIVSVQIKKITNLDKAIRDGFSKDENSIIDRLKNIDVKKLNTKQLIKINNILNNIETNGDFSDAGYVDVIAKFQKAIPKIDGILKNSNLFKFKNTKIWDTIRTKRSLDAIMQRLTLVNRTAASKLNVAFGDTDLSLNNVKVNDFVKKVLEIIQKYEDTKPSVKDEHTNEVVAYLIQNTATTDKEKEAQFKQAKDNLKTSYENLKRGNKDEQNLGKLQEEIYKDLDLDNVNNQQQLIDKYSKMNKTAMDYLFKMQKIYEEIEPLFRKNQEKYNNTTYPKIQYYTPIKHRTLSTEVEEDLKGEEEYLKSSMGINASMSKSSIKRVGMNKNQYIDTDFNKLMYTRANDIANQAYTLPDRAFMHELFNSKEFLELFGEENARVLRDAFESKVNHVMNKYPIPSKTQKKINDGLKPLDRIINLSSVRALNGALQSVKQMVVLVNTISDLTLSGNADLIDKSFKAKWDKSFETFLKRMPISLREGTKGGTNLSKDIDEITESKIRTELENLYKAYGLATENMAEKTLYFLRKGDSFPAELSWAAYYMESLKNQGIDVDNINWEEENNKINDGEESRKEAIAYAEAKVSSKQNVSDPANVSELIANKDVLVRIVRSLIAPLSSYAINTRNRLNDDLLAIAKGGDKKAAVIDITATLAELYAYGVMINVISAFILEPAMEMMLDEFGFDPEKDPREWDEILKDIFTKKAAWNAMADFLTTGTTIFGEKYGKDALNSIYTALNGKTKNANDYFNITPEESKKNEKEQNDYDRTLPFRTKTLTETFGKAGTLGILLDLSTNALSSLSYVYDDEARMKEGVRLGKTRVEGLKKGEFEKSFISPVELTPNEEKFFVISGMISASTMLIPMFSEITSVNRMAYQKAIRQAKAKYGEPERTSAGEPFAKKEPTGFYTNVFKLMDEKENLLKSGLSSSVKNEKLKEIDEKLKREYMRRAGVNEVKQEQFSRFLRDLTRQRGERIKRGLR